MLRESVTRTPGTEVRVTFARPDHPIAYGYPKTSQVFRGNFALYSTPRRTESSTSSISNGVPIKGKNRAL